MRRVKLIAAFSAILFGCKNGVEYSDFTKYPSPTEENLWVDYTPTATTFKLWSPTAEEVKLLFYKDGDNSISHESHTLTKSSEGVWSKNIPGDHAGTYYTFQVKINGKWLNETPGIYAQAVGVNGHRAMVIDLEKTNPEGWNVDKGPQIKTPNEAIIYELHIRDMTISPSSGASAKGKYLGLVESGTRTPKGIATGIDHIKEMGITHVHLLPTFDHYSIDETNLDSAQFNWGYDPQNYNVPEGSFSSDPYNAEVRIKEFKQMVKTFHEAGIGVILDVVYNHTGKTAESNFNQEVPGYYYRQWADGKWSDASACGNETSSDRPMTRKFIVESVKYWAKEYHLDGFRFDLMGIHDIETMNEVALAVKKINPNAFVYGEGWTAGDSPLPQANRALKASTKQMPNVSAFSDDIRDGIKGSVFDEKSTGFVSGDENLEETIKFGVVGSIDHPQIEYKKVNYSDTSWANEPWQAVSYVSCHDNHTLFDKLTISQQDATPAEIEAMHKLANAIVLTSQGVPFLHAGVEMLRTKGGEHNSYNKPDSVNQIDWTRKAEYNHIVEYYRQIIGLRKNHPAFYMPNAQMVRDKLSFVSSNPGIVAYQIHDNANSDSWKNILVIYNANKSAVTLPLTGKWTIAVQGSEIDEAGITNLQDTLNVPALSMMIAFQE
ncbi:type I pullulanase [Fulvivirga lutea]|uniref:Type I pullulanase n=1 Tax=Fulvivirga lutea TaxID=2810512 RepID=A0A974ZZG9_9BACT|nr:type I pullulanase [Fulvivirga lutea]QSE96070.1 type I pullulanase [Fulvivirga lutea]